MTTIFVRIFLPKLNQMLKPDLKKLLSTFLYHVSLHCERHLHTSDWQAVPDGIGGKKWPKFELNVTRTDASYRKTAWQAMPDGIGVKKWPKFELNVTRADASHWNTAWQAMSDGIGVKKWPKFELNASNFLLPKAEIMEQASSADCLSYCWNNFRRDLVTALYAVINYVNKVRLLN
jgi:hypothetical protein